VLAIVIPLVLMVSLVASYFYVPRVQNFINGHLESMKARYLVWEAAWKGFLEKPLLGWGPENYNIVFVEHFDPRLFLREFGGEVWFDRSHNIILDTLVTTGIFGLISYLSIFFVSVFYLFRKIKKQENPKFNLVIIALLAAYLFQNMTVFDIISSYMTFFLTLAYIAYLGDKEGNRKEIEGCSNPLMKKIAYSAVFVLIGGLIYFGNIQPARGSTNTLIAIVGRRLEDRVNAYEETLTIPRYNTETNRYFASQLINNSLEKEVDKELIEKGATLAERSIREDIEESPSDYRSYLSLSRVYIAKYRVTQDKKELDLAEKILNEAIQLSPQNQNAYWLLSDVKIQQGNIEESIKAIRKTIDLEPRFYRAHWYLVSSYMMQENYEAAYNAIQEAEEYGIDWTKNLEDASKILTIYERVSGREEAISFAQKLLEKYPNNAELWLGMAIYSYNAGNFEEAKEAAEKAVQLNPGIETSNKELIETLLNGNLTN
jgi:tetratricopeptide (TPR) repeat protein